MRTRLFAALALALPLFSVACTGPTPTHVVLKTPTPVVQPKRAVDPSQFIALSADTDNRFVKDAAPGELTLRLRLDAKALESAARPPINLALVVDTSGSMEGKAISDARDASLALLDALEEGDRLAVVAFHSGTEILVPSTLIDKSNREEVKARIRAMKASGTTDMAGGLKAGLGEVLDHLDSKGVNRIVMLGDGVPNEDSTILPLAKSAQSRGVSITALGLGLDYDETLMTRIARSSGGKYHFVRDSERVAAVFKEEVLRLRRVVAKNIGVRLATGPGVVIEEVIGSPAPQGGRSTHIGIGDMSEGETRDLIVRLKTPSRTNGALVELCDASITFQAPSEANQQFAESTFVSVRATSDLAQLESGHNAEVEKSAARQRLADRIVQAIATARAGDPREAQAMLDLAKREAHKDATRLGDEELEAKAAEIDELRASLPTYVQQQQLAVPGPLPQPMAMPLERPMARPSAAPAAIVLESQAAAVRMIQGR